MCPVSINLAILALSACADNLMTSCKVWAESKYTVPTANESAKTGADVMKNATNNELLNMVLALTH